MRRISGATSTRKRNAPSKASLLFQWWQSPEGGWGPEGLKTLQQLAKTVAGRARGDADTSMGQLLQSLSVIIRSAKARAVLRRAGQPQDPGSSAVEAAAAAVAASTD